MPDVNNKSPEVVHALEIINRELYFVIQSRAKNPKGEGVGLWRTHWDLGDDKRKRNGNIKGKKRAYHKMEMEAANHPHRLWRVIQKDNANFYQEGVNDKSKLVEALEEVAREASMKLAAAAGKPDAFQMLGLTSAVNGSY